MRFLSYVMLCCLLAATVACSGGNTVTTPDLSPDRQIETATRGMWGLYDVMIDTETMEATVVPARTAEFRINVNTFMNANPTLLQLSNLDGTNLKTTGELTLDVTLTHPIAGNPKLAGFDVHAVFLSNSSATLAYDADLGYPIATDEPILLNADGWTRWHNKVEFTTPGIFGYVAGRLGNNDDPTATLNGYKLFADGLNKTTLAGSWLNTHQDDRAIFRNGASNTREFKLQFPLVGGNPVLKFQYAVVASWEKPPVDNPEPSDFPEGANIQEASHIRIDTSGSTLYYTPSNDGGDIVLDVDIFDWQGGDDIEGEIARIIVECSVLDDPYIDSTPSLDQDPGGSYATWSATIPADDVASADPVDVWVIIESADPSDYNSGTGAAYPEGAALAAFNKKSVTVSEEPPVEPPVIHAGVLILSGTSQCPDRGSDTNGVFQVVATGDAPLTYHWEIKIFRKGDNVPGYDDVPGDGAGNLTVDFTDSAFQNIPETLLVNCSVTDGVNPAVSATPLFVWLDCIIFHADFENPELPDNNWFPFDEEGATQWTPMNATDNGSNLTGTGALFQNDSGNVDSNSQGILRSNAVAPVVNIFTGGRVEITHSYNFVTNQCGGSVKLDPPLVNPTVGGEPAAISSGHGYTGTVTDGTNPLNPYSAWTQTNTPSDPYLSIINVTTNQLTNGFVIGLQAATGNSVSVTDGGWLIDDVTVYGIL